MEAGLFALMRLAVSPAVCLAHQGLQSTPRYLSLNFRGGLAVGTLLNAAQVQNKYQQLA